LFRTFY